MPYAITSTPCCRNGGGENEQEEKDRRTAAENERFVSESDDTHGCVHAESAGDDRVPAHAVHARLADDQRALPLPLDRPPHHRRYPGGHDQERVPHPDAALARPDQEDRPLRPHNAHQPPHSRGVEMGEALRRRRGAHHDRGTRKPAGSAAGLRHGHAELVQGATRPRPLVRGDA